MAPCFYLALNDVKLRKTPNALNLRPPSLTLIITKKKRSRKFPMPISSSSTSYQPNKYQNCPPQRTHDLHCKTPESKAGRENPSMIALAFSIYSPRDCQSNALSRGRLTNSTETSVCIIACSETKIQRICRTRIRLYENSLERFTVSVSEANAVRSR